MTDFDAQLRTLVRDLLGTPGGMLARCTQHETDHLDGVLFIDRQDADQQQRLNPIV